jgi:hypothetical protein
MFFVCWHRISVVKPLACSLYWLSYPIPAYNSVRLYFLVVYNIYHHQHHHQWLFSPSGLWPPLIQFRNQFLRRTVGQLGRMISWLQDLYVHRTTKHRKTKDKHLCPKRDSNPRSSVQALKSHAADRAATASAYQTHTARKVKQMPVFIQNLTL